MTIKYFLSITITVLTLHASLLLLSGCTKQKGLTAVKPLAKADSSAEPEWQEIIVSRPASYDKNVLLTAQELKRKDGFTVIRIGLGREFQETFLCKGAFDEFEFTACRWDESTNSPTDTYIIYLTFFGKPIPPKSEVTDLIIKSHAKDIESALLHFPPIQFSNLKPRKVKAVRFHISDHAHHSYQLMSADELIH